MRGTAIRILSPQVQAVIAGLAKFGCERIGNWKYHFGELQSSQSATLDDSAWGEIRPPSCINRTGENWLRKWIVLPARDKGNDLKGFRILVSLGAHVYGGQGPTISIKEKTITQANHSEPEVGFYKSGDRVLMAIQYGKKSAASGLHSDYSYIDFNPSRPYPAEMYAQFVTATLPLANSDQMTAQFVRIRWGREV